MEEKLVKKVVREVIEIMDEVRREVRRIDRDESKKLEKKLEDLYYGWRGIEFCINRECGIEAYEGFGLVRVDSPDPIVVEMNTDMKMRDVFDLVREKIIETLPDQLNETITIIEMIISDLQHETTIKNRIYHLKSLKEELRSS